jgi:glutathione S-transferase
MITLYTFGPNFGLHDPSPFVTKADLLLKFSGVPYCTRPAGLRGAPKGKLPYLDDDGVKIADSTFIRLHLEQKYGIDFDPQLSAAQKGFAWSVEKMLEDHLYWAALVHPRWMDDASFDKGPRRFFDPVPALLRPFVANMVRGKVRKTLHAHGIGRHSNAEIATLANRGVDAVAGVLGNGSYLLGTHKCGADATAFAFVSGILCPYFDSPQRTHAERHANLRAYCERMKREFYPDI